MTVAEEVPEIVRIDVDLQEMTEAEAREMGLLEADEGSGENEDAGRGS